MQIFTDRVSIVRAGVKPGDYGGTEQDWGHPEVIEVPNPVSVQPTASTDLEDSPSRQAVQATHRLYTRPPDLLDQLQPTDRIRVSGWPFDLDVVGTPAHWRTRALRHTEVDLKEIHG